MIFVLLVIIGVGVGVARGLHRDRDKIFTIAAYTFISIFVSAALCILAVVNLPRETIREKSDSMKIIDFEVRSLPPHSDTPKERILRYHYSFNEEDMRGQKYIRHASVPKESSRLYSTSADPEVEIYNTYWYNPSIFIFKLPAETSYVFHLTAQQFSQLKVS